MMKSFLTNLVGVAITAVPILCASCQGELDGATALDEAEWTEKADSADTLKQLKSGKWSCTLDEPRRRKYFKGTAPYSLTLKQGGRHQSSQALELRQSDSKTLTALRNSEGYFIPKSGTIYPRSRWGYWMMSPAAADFSEIELTIATRESEGSYRNDRMNCRAVEPPVLVTPAVSKFTCETSAEFIDGKRFKFKFALKNMDDPSAIDFVWPDDEDASPVAVTPRNQTVSAINENVSVGVSSRQIRISGDSDGFFLIHLVLDKAGGYTRGYLKLEDLSEGVGNHKTDVTCTRP